MNLRYGVEKSFLNILDTFTGADGGIRFVNFKSMIEMLDKQAGDGDPSSEHLIQIMLQFSRLIDVANKETPK